MEHNFDSTLYDDPRDLKIAADKILQDQDFDLEVSMWLFGSIGRMIFDVNTYDNFSYAFILNGVGGTGKSQLLNQVLTFYDESFNGRILSSGRAAFSLEHLYQSLVTVCGEVVEHNFDGRQDFTRPKISTPKCRCFVFFEFEIISFKFFVKNFPKFKIIENLFYFFPIEEILFSKWSILRLRFNVKTTFEERILFNVANIV